MGRKTTEAIENAAEKPTKAIAAKVQKQILGTDPISIIMLLWKDFLGDKSRYELNLLKKDNKKITRDHLRK